MTNAFKPGDVVVLKSGGPPMTIDKLPQPGSPFDEARAGYHCKWFKGATAEQGYYREATLEAYTPPVKK